MGLSFSMHRVLADQVVMFPKSFGPWSVQSAAPATSVEIKEQVGMSNCSYQWDT